MKGRNRNKPEAILKEVKDFPTSPGLYFMKDAAEKVLYIGKAKNLRSRVSSYFQPAADIQAARGAKIAEMIRKVQTVDYMETKSEVDAVLQEARLIKDIRPPYNTDLTDGKSFPYLEITTSEDFPGVYITRTPRQKGRSRLFGPFGAGKELRQTLVVLQKIFQFRTCKLEISEDDDKRKFFRPCLLHSIKQCTAPCAAKIEKSEYRNIIKELIKFLQSKRTTFIKRLKRQMQEASERMEYEKAAMLRDRIRIIERLDYRGSPKSNVQPELFAEDPADGLVKLSAVLGCEEPIRVIEGIDIAHISGAQAVGSLVKFIDGRPFKNGYRRFKIKHVKGVDDYAMISEVVSRRYKYALKGEELWPDVILIDGGKGQLNAAEKTLKTMNAPDVKVLGLAKREEEIFTLDSDAPLKLSRNSPALKLLQYVRDEAHRFAQHYHHLLRNKSVLKGKRGRKGKRKTNHG
jgi:excinuclease ABC subunit C